MGSAGIAYHRPPRTVLCAPTVQALPTIPATVLCVRAYRANTSHYTCTCTIHAYCANTSHYTCTCSAPVPTLALTPASKQRSMTISLAHRGAGILTACQDVRIWPTVRYPLSRYLVKRQKMPRERCAAPPLKTKRGTPDYSIAAPGSVNFFV